MSYEKLEITTAQAEGYAKSHFGITATAKALLGYDDFNFQLKTMNNEIFILKISRDDVNLTALEYQIEILNHLENKKMNIDLPKSVKDKAGKSYFSFIDEAGRKRWLRLNTWVDGKMVFEVKHQSTELLESWGRACGELVKNLQDFEHEGGFIGNDWDLSISLNNRQYRQYIQDEKQLAIVDYCWDLFEKTVLPIQPKLQKGIIHSDLNDYNVLINSNLTEQRVTGVIDFGDSVYAAIVNDLAIACAYAILEKPNPLEAAASLVKGFHHVFPLQDEALQVLFALIGGRLTTTVSNAAKNHHFNPNKAYLFVSEAQTWDVLELWYKIPPNLAYYTFRYACDLMPCPKEVIYNRWFSDHYTTFSSVVNVFNKKIKPLDLSVSSLDLGNNGIFENINIFQKRIDDILWAKDAVIGIGGYGEIRPFYNSDAYILPSNNGRQWRTVHLGLDIWTSAGTPVFAPLDGTIYSLQDNAGDCNYGPTIILEHCVKQGEEAFTFYTLYGHLSPISNGLHIGQPIKKGTQIATIGTFPQNGNWPEHLHFQVILDMLEQKGDFFGVCTPNDRAIWLSICPNPYAYSQHENIIANNQTSTAFIFKQRQRYLGKNLSLSYQKPLHIVRAYKQYLYAENGRRYLDTVNNVAHVGHQHPEIVAAGQRQMAVLNTNTRYLHENIVRYAEELLATFPPELCVCYFVNSGSEANELALRMAKVNSNQEDMLAVEVGYHGNTNGTIAVSSYKFDSKGGNGRPPHTHLVPMPDVYRGAHKNPETAGKLYAQYLQDKIQYLQKENKNIAGFICESILSCGGQIVLPKDYLKTAYEYVRQAGGVCIADEVQVGFGRVGETFWGFELQNVVPDIVTMGKPIGNGHPLAAVVTTRAVADAFDNGMEYFNTFGGNQVSCAIGQAVLKVIQSENLQENALNVGNYLKEKLNVLKEKYPIIGDVRGHGLFLGIELVRDATTLEPATLEAEFIVNQMQENAILMSTDGPFHNVLKIKPPMCFSKNDADFLVVTFETILDRLDFSN